MILNNDGSDVDACDWARHRVESYDKTSLLNDLLTHYSNRWTFDASWAQVTPCPDCQNGGSCQNGGCCACPYGWGGCDCTIRMSSPPLLFISFWPFVPPSSFKFGNYTIRFSFPLVALCANACQRGYCASPDNCACPYGWGYPSTGCVTRMSFPPPPFFSILKLSLFLSALCSAGCNNGGYCSNVDSCTCGGGWSGASSGCNTRTPPSFLLFRSPRSTFYLFFV